MSIIKLINFKLATISLLLIFSKSVSAFELLSEGAMGSVSAISANTAEEIVSVAGSSAAGLRVDDEYEVLPFKVSVEVDATDLDEVSKELNYTLVQEIGSWADSLRQRSEVVTSAGFELGYIDELPSSSFDESAFVIRDQEFERLIFEPENARVDDQNNTVYEVGKVDQTITKLQQNVDSVQYIVERKVDFVATIDASVSNNSPSIGSGFISNLTSMSNVRIATVRD